MGGGRDSHRFSSPQIKNGFLNFCGELNLWETLLIYHDLAGRGSDVLERMFYSKVKEAGGVLGSLFRVDTTVARKQVQN